MDFYGYFHGKLMERRIHKIRLLGPRIYKEAPGQAAPVFGTGSKSMETMKLRKKRGFGFHSVATLGAIGISSSLTKSDFSPLIKGMIYVFPISPELYGIVWVISGSCMG
jgi:hypothetical protein